MRFALFWTFGTAIFFSCETGAVQEAKEDPLRTAAKWLWLQQGRDGGWHSPKYGFLKGGETYTAFAMYALSLVPDSVWKPEETAVNRGLNFIREHIRQNGVLGTGDSGILEYPNYATAYALRVLIHHNREEDRGRIATVVQYLRKEQFEGNRGISDTMAAYGAWGFGETNLKYGEFGYVDISHTRRVTEALNAAEQLDTHAIRACRSFLRLCQKHPADARVRAKSGGRKTGVPFDGGFFYSPVIEGANKGKSDSGNDSVPAYFKSYATATCDGILSLLGTGATPGRNPDLDSAISWLRKRPEMDPPPGLPLDELEPWYKAMHYYHLMVRAEVYRKLGWDCGEIGRILSAEQYEDGHFENRMSPLMKEDDPVLATCMAVIAMSNCR